MSPGNPLRKQPRWGTWLFALSMLVFWLALGLGGNLWPPQPLEKQQTLPWPESARQGVRRVVLQTPVWHWPETWLEWSDSAPRVEVQADHSGQLSWQLVHEGDTLYVRMQTATTPEARAQMPRPETYVKKIVLPPSVDTVQGRRLQVLAYRDAPAPHTPPRLSLQGVTIEVSSNAELEHLHLSAWKEDQTCPINRGDVLWRKWMTHDTRLRIETPHAKQLLIEADGSEIKLNTLHDDARVQLHASARSSLTLEQATQLPQIDWQALPAERLQALEEISTVLTIHDCQDQNP